MKKRVIALAMAAAVLCGCSGKGEKSGKKEELPADRPYNRYIMETDKGYYTDSLGGYGQLLALRFCERDTGNQIFLCAKPECTHDGSDKCTATYKKMSCLHSTLYDGAIYSFLVEKGDNVTLSLYKSSLDGTSITKVGDVFSVANSSDEERIDTCDGTFAIHKGYAYLPYCVVLGDSPLFGFAGSGLVKMDITSGKTEELWSGEKYFSGQPQDIYGDGDYIYYTITAHEDGGFYRYDTKSGETKKLWEKKNPITGESKFFFMEHNDEQGKWNVVACGKTDEDIEKAEAEGYEFVIGDIDTYQHGSMRAYEDKLILVDEGKVKVFSDSGEALGEIAFLTEEEKGDSYEYSDPYFLTDISDGKIYFYDEIWLRDIDLCNELGYSIVIRSCPIDDVIAGTGKWKEEFVELDIFSSGLMKEELPETEEE